MSCGAIHQLENTSDEEVTHLGSYQSKSCD